MLTISIVISSMHMLISGTVWNRAGAVRLFSFYTRAGRQPLVSHYLRVCVHACVRACVRACLLRACVHACCVHACMPACVRACVCVCACRCVFPDILDLTPHLPTLHVHDHASLVWPQPSVSPFLVILCFVQCAMFECLTPDSCPAIGYLYTLNNTICDQI